MTRPAAHSSRLTRLLAPVLAAATIIAGGVSSPPHPPLRQTRSGGAGDGHRGSPADLADQRCRLEPGRRRHHVYVTGSFTKARPPGVAAGGAGEIDANNVFAFDITTGNPVAGFAHAFDAQGLVVRAAPDGKPSTSAATSPPSTARRVHTWPPSTSRRVR